MSWCSIYIYIYGGIFMCFHSSYIFKINRENETHWLVRTSYDFLFYFSLPLFRKYTFTHSTCVCIKRSVRVCAKNSNAMKCFVWKWLFFSLLLWLKKQLFHLDAQFHYTNGIFDTQIHGRIGFVSLKIFHEITDHCWLQPVLITLTALTSSFEWIFAKKIAWIERRAGKKTLEIFKKKKQSRDALICFSYVQLRICVWGISYSEYTTTTTTK